MGKYQTIAVIYGSDSSECEVSCRSGEFVASRIDGNEYDIFTEKTSNTTSNVVFTYKTDAITVPEQSAEQSAETQETEGFVTRIKNLFK